MYTPSPSAPPTGGLTATPLISGNQVPEAVPGATPAPQRRTSVHRISFTGSGPEYFRIWIVNLLLILVTLGLYYPYAKVRKTRYFMDHTVVAGYPLAYHATPRKMMRGFLLVAVLMGLYSLAGQSSDLASLVSVLLLAGLWPALMRSSLQFRLANTSWRGLRMAFTGSMKDAYLVYLMPALMVVGAVLLSSAVLALLPGDISGFKGLLAGLAGGLGVLAAVPYAWWRLKTYQHNHYALGQLQTTFRASYREVAGVFLRTGLISLGGMVAVLAVILAVPEGSALLQQFGGSGGVMQVIAVAVVTTLVVVYVATQFVAGPYFISRTQNLIWTQTGSPQLRFKSHLKLWPLAGLTLLNAVLVPLSLGLYWPFASVALARMRLQAIEVHTSQDPDLLIAQWRGNDQDAAGDLAADLIGIDVGL